MISCKTVHLKTTPINEEEADSEEYSNSEADDVCALRFKKPCWQVRVLFLSLLINPLLYRVYQILVTIGYIFCSSGSSDQICLVKVCANPKVDLSWTGMFPCEPGWKGSVLAVVILSIAYSTACYYLVTVCATKLMHRRLIKPIKICSLTEYNLQQDRFQESLQYTNRIVLNPTLSAYLLLLAFHLLLQCGDIETNPGPTNNEYETMVTCGKKIVEGLSRDPDGLAVSFHGERLISSEEMDRIINIAEGKTMKKARNLYILVLRVVKLYPDKYNDFIAILHQDWLHKELLEELQRTLEHHKKKKSAHACHKVSPSLKDFIENEIRKEWSLLLCQMETKIHSADKLSSVLKHFGGKFAETQLALATESLTVKTIFEKLTSNQLWSYSEFGLLATVIEYTSGDLKPELDEYVFKYHGHILAIKIVERLPLLESSSKDIDTPPLTLAMSIELAESLQISEKMTQFSTDYVNKLWKEGRHYHNIPPLTVVVSLIMSHHKSDQEASASLVSATLPVPGAERTVAIHQVVRNHCAEDLCPLFQLLMSKKMTSIYVPDLKSPPTTTYEQKYPRLNPKKECVPSVHQFPRAMYRVQAKKFSQQPDPEEGNIHIVTTGKDIKSKAENLDSLFNQGDSSFDQHQNIPESMRDSHDTTVDLNPEDHMCSIRNVANGIVEVMWPRLLGIQLGLTPIQLDEIESYPTGEHKLRLVESWFRLESNPTWEKLVAALKAPLVHENKIASEIEYCFIPQRGSLAESESEKIKQPVEKGLISSVFGALTKPISVIFEALRRKTVSEKLLAACRSKTPDIAEIRGYLEQDECDVNIREDDEFQWSPLMWACENNHFEIGRLLLKYKPQVNIQDKKEWSPLVLASRAGDLEIVQGIVELEAEIDKPTNKLWTPLMWAAQEGHARVAKFLLKSGAFVDFPDENGWTPLMQASQEGHVDVVNVLLDHGANANHQTDTTWCALMAAAKNKHSEVVDALLRKGAEVDLARDDGSTTLQVASYYKGNSAVVNVLIKHGANVDHRNIDGMTALMLATNKGHLDTVQALIDGGADIDAQHPETGWPAVFFAAKIGDTEIFKELLHKGAKTEMEGANVAEVAGMFKRTWIVKEFQKFEQASHRQISSHVPTLEPSPSTVVEPEIPTHEPKVSTPPTDTPTQQTGQVPLDTTSPKEETSGSTTAGSGVKPVATIVAEPVTTEAPEQVQQEPVTVSTVSSKKDIEEVTPQDLGPEVATSDEVVGDSDQSALPTSTETPTKAEPSVSEKETEIKAADEPSQTEEEQKLSLISTKTTIEEPEQHSEAKKTSKIGIKQKAEIIDLLMQGFGSRLANPKSNRYRGDTNEAGSSLHQKGLQFADVITHKLTSAPSHAQRKTQGYVEVEPDDVLFS